MEFNEYGYLLAASENDAYNALVCNHFAAEMGRNHVFQFPDTSMEEPDPKRLQRTVRGLIMPADRAWLEDLMSNWYRGWTFQKTLLTEEYNYERFKDTCPEGSLSVAVVKSGGGIQLHSPEHPIKPKSGDVVIWFGPKPEKSKPEKPKPAKTMTANDKTDGNPTAKNS